MPDLEEEIGRLNTKGEEVLWQITGDGTQPESTRNAAAEVFKAIQDNKLVQLYTELQRATPVLVGFINQLAEVAKTLNDAAGGASSQGLRDLLDQIGEAYGAEVMRSAAASKAEAKEPTTDEESEAPSGQPQPLSAATGAATPLVEPKPINSSKYTRLSDEYIRFFRGADYSAKAREVERYAGIVLAHQGEYLEIGNHLNGIPWWFIAGCHLLESGCNFSRHLHNGDSLRRRTVNVPSDRPVQAGTGPNGSYTFVESAIDAMKLKKFDRQTDWSLARALYRWEANNGFGYRSRGVPTPYLWSFSSLYRTGKFVRDHVYDPGAISEQCGAGVLLRCLADKGQVDLKLDYVADPEQGIEPSFSNDADIIDPDTHPTVDGPLPANDDFAAFVQEKVSGLRHFKSAEFLVKGSANATLKLNTDPPPELWPNCITLIEVLDEFRERIQHPVVINSVYRNEDYNLAIGGAPGSWHKKFRAADIQVRGPGRPNEWASLLRQMRNEGVFSGGIGIYGTFVHVDTRGWDANW